MRSPDKSPETTFTITNVRVAFECPRLFYLEKHFGGNTLFLPSHRIQGIGSDFHKLADSFIETAKKEPRFVALFEPPAEQLNPDAIATQMQQLFYELKFYKYLEAEIKKNRDRSPALHQIWQGLTNLIYQFSELLIKNRHYCQPATVIHKTLISGELSLKHRFPISDCAKQILTGRLDGLLYDCQLRRFCVVDYKTYQPVDISAQLAQVALYSFILKEKKNILADSAVYCVFPEFKKYYYSWEQLESSFHSLIPEKLQQMQVWLSWKQSQPDPPPMTAQLHLCEICPQRKKCQKFFEETAGESIARSPGAKSEKKSSID